jgi:hypothetical protein
MTLKQLERLAAQRASQATRYWRPPSEWPWTDDIEHPQQAEWYETIRNIQRRTDETITGTNLQICDTNEFCDNRRDSNNARGDSACVEPNQVHDNRVNGNGHLSPVVATTIEASLYSPSTPDREVKLGEAYLREKYAWIHAKLIRVGTSAQWTAVVQLVQSYCAPGEVQNLQIIAPTGAGKSYVIAAFLHIVMEEMPGRFRIPGRMLPVVIEPPKVVPQMYQILAEFRVAALVTSLASLRATLGESMLEWKTVVVNKQPTLYPFWRMDCATTLIVVDESQQVKNEDSSQSTIIESAAGHGIPILPVSATPYSRISQGKIIACAIRPWIEFGGVKMRLSPKIWKSWASDLTPPGYAITDWTPKGLKRFQEHLEPYTVRFSVPYKHKIITRTVACEFPSERSRKRYDDAFKEWQMIREKRRKDPLVGVIAELVALAKFNQVAEEERAEPLVAAAYEMWEEREKDASKKQKFAIILGFAQRTALERALKHFEKLKGAEWVRKNVATIVGGKNCEPDKEAFQRDRKPFLLLTIACGGAGLSLDQNRMNKRQRYMFASAVWNDIQMAQLAGRTQRVMTESASYLYLMYFKGTTELDKLTRVLRKIKCLKEVTTRVSVHTAKDGESGSFVDGIEQIRHHDSGDDMELPPPEDEDQEETLAGQVVGTQQTIDIDVEITTNE